MPKTNLSFNDWVILKDIKAATTNGGTFTSGAWRTRDLNTTENSQPWASLSTNQFTLQAGTYEIEWSAPALAVDLHKSRLRNITDSTTDLVGSAETASVSGTADTIRSVGKGLVTIASAKVFEIQHQCQTTGTTNGFGAASGFSESEIYTIVKIKKIA